MTAEEWADAGLASVYDALELRERPRELIADELYAAIRKAYIDGYMDALEEEHPLNYQEAMERAETLRLRVPVV